MTKALVRCDRIMVRIKKNKTLLFFFEGNVTLEQELNSRGFAKCSGVVRSTKQKCGPMLEAGTCIRVGASTEY